jgi:hypothetical protein
MPISSKAHKFWTLVNKNGPVHPTLGKCWEWMGYKQNGRYGKLSCLGMQTHRYSWTIHHGAIPEGLSVLHHCDNPKCVNPKHLFLGTQQDNLADMRSKGHQVRGESQGSAKLTAQQVRDIRALYRRYSHEYGSAALARKYGVSPIQIWKIATRQQWRHV